MNQRTFLKCSIILGGASLTAAWPKLASATASLRSVNQQLINAWSNMIGLDIVAQAQAYAKMT